MHKKILCWQDADWNIAYNKNNQKPGQTNKWRVKDYYWHFGAQLAAKVNRSTGITAYLPLKTYLHKSACLNKYEIVL